MHNAIASWKQRAGALRRETYALFLAYRDRRVPWYAKAFAACVVAYAFSPLDLIPDFIPVLGYVDDLILVPLGIALALRMIPPEVMVESRVKAQAVLSGGQPRNWIAAAAIVGIWLLLAAMAVLLAARVVGH